MRSTRSKLIALLVFTALLLGGVASIRGQFSGSRRVRVYNPGTYHRTRSVISRRAAVHKIHKKKKRHRAARRHRHN